MGILIALVIGILVGIALMAHPPCPVCHGRGLESTDYWQRVKELAAKEGVNGCTGVMNLHSHCCDEHDLHLLYRRRLSDDTPIDNKKWADLRWRACVMRSSLLGAWSPYAWLGYWAIRRFGRKW